MRERGSAMLTAVMAVMVLLLISGAFFQTIIFQSKLESSEEKAIRAYYLSEAGINYQIGLVLNNLAVPLPQNTPDSVTSPFGAAYGGRFITKWMDDGNTYTFTVTSDGFYQGITRTLNAQYKYPTPLEPPLPPL